MFAQLCCKHFSVQRTEYPWNVLIYLVNKALDRSSMYTCSLLFFTPPPRFLFFSLLFFCLAQSCAHRVLTGEHILTLLRKQYSCPGSDEYIVDSATIYATVLPDHISIANYSAPADKHSIKVHSYK